ncbi:MAG TPA: hypothetical protein VGI79_21255 [Caulobacteraceae bacterium]|jgi:hydrogenase/urease accessory protein HupE
MTRRTLWLRLAGLALAVAGLVFVFVAPISTISVKVDLPPGVDPASADKTIAGTTDLMTHIVIPVVDAALILAVLGFGLFFARRILRRHKAEEAETEELDVD